MTDKNKASEVPARKECERLWLEEKVMIQHVTVKQLIDRDFRQELEYIWIIGG